MDHEETPEVASKSTLDTVTSQQPEHKWYHDEDTNTQFYCRADYDEHMRQGERPPRDDRESYVDNPVIRASRKGFKKAFKVQTPHPYDLVFFHAQSVVKDFNANLIATATSPVQSFAYEYDPWNLEALSISPTMFYKDGYESVSAVHCLMRQDYLVKVQLKLVCNIEIGWSSATVMVRDADRWITLAKLLDTLGGSDLKTVGPCGYGLQFLWWRKMQKASNSGISKRAQRRLATSTDSTGNLEKLPVEIRMKFLMHCLGERVAPKGGWRSDENRQSSRDFTVLTRGDDMKRDPRFPEHDDPYTIPRVVLPSNVSVLQLNKATRALALEVLNKATIKVYSHPGNLTIHTKANYNFLQRLELCFENDDYIDFFRVDLRPFNEHPRWQLRTAGALMLKDLELLNELKIYFFDSANRSHTPWYSEVSDGGQRTRNEWAEYRRLPCQKVLVDWILCFAAEYINAGVSVELNGCIDPEIKTKWESIFNDKGPTDHIAMIEAQREEIRNTPKAAL
ncbi:hypothetical protein LTR27_010779 [Elasticomyces elasticus]|nr:hypothetical protein LTR27_010779 [Elasticomyces elasticus]